MTFVIKDWIQKFLDLFSSKKYNNLLKDSTEIFFIGNKLCIISDSEDEENVRICPKNLNSHFMGDLILTKKKCQKKDYFMDSGSVHLCEACGNYY